MVGFTETATVRFVPFFETRHSETQNSETRHSEIPSTSIVGRTAQVHHGSAGPRTELDHAANRTDRAVALRVAHALAELHVPILRTLEVSVHEGHVTLRGRVRNYYERQLARSQAKRTPGVVGVSEEISVAG